MRYALDSINTGLIKLLETDNNIQYPSGTNISVYTEVPNEDADFPMIILEPNSMIENNVTRDSIGQSHIMNIEVISKFKQGAGGWGANNNISNQVLGLIRNKSFHLDLLVDNFRVINQTIQAVQPIRDAYKDGVYFRTIIIAEFNVEDLA